MVKAIIFDLWNTLSYNDPFNPHNFVLSKIGLEKNMHNDRIIEEELMVSKEDFGILVTNMLRKFGVNDKSVAKEIEETWKKSRLILFPEVIDCFKRFRKNHKLAILSNSIAIDIPKIRESGIMEHINYAGFSFETGLLKPDIRAFEDVLKNLNIRPEEAMMVGDNLTVDIVPAEKLGMKAVLIRRKNEFERSHTERGKYKFTIKSLNELERFL
ncbi:MAG: HAD-IA family hydrolase [Candidatus Aenigmarchaeota archaeon]|nr:HAD-IA family hydrolase [Candidatus Aenigmarchaeota archaeon]NIP40809.1 HAD-IA family hydrolase [Candidatus Aenigmarchaeota archaeon]NIQ17923.1 HAD-IA family hydrolase [Candidatus Aenigmarchaeota archaeon]NIS73512.1 HAD-IA family hydrolase [Candidatus Aenigmarchaeota archaeon]